MPISPGALPAGVLPDMPFTLGTDDVPCVAALTPLPYIASQVLCWA